MVVFHGNGKNDGDGVLEKSIRVSSGFFADQKPSSFLGDLSIKNGGVMGYDRDRDITSGTPSHGSQ
jgi:hypothetical protein